MRESYNRGHTVQFTWTSSVAPDSAPVLAVTGIDNTLINSITSTSSDSTNYYVLYTMPTSVGIYLAEWVAEKTVVSSTYPFKKAFLFNVIEPKRTP